LRTDDGLVYSGEVMPHAEADDARSVLAEGARSLGLLAARAIAMEESGDMEPKWYASKQAARVLAS